MQRHALIITALAGFASAALFVAAPTNFLMAMLQVLTQLPLLYCGLALGFSMAALSSGIAGVIVLVLGGLIPLLFFALASAIPSLILVRQTLLFRSGANGAVEWYPIGLTVAQLTGYFLIVSVVAIFVIQSQAVDISATIEQAIQELGNAMALPQGQALDPELISGLALYVPGMMAVGFLTFTLLNSVIAQKLAARGGQAKRPTPTLAEFELPSRIVIVMAAAVVATLFLDGTLLMIAASAMLLSMTLFFFQGLAVIHAYLKPRPWRGPGLVLLYMLVVFLGWVAFFIVVLGLIDDRVHLRRRMS